MISRATILTISGMLLTRLALVLGAVALSLPTFAAGIDSRTYTCPEVQRLILSKGYVFINNLSFQDFVVSNVSYCSGGGMLQLRTVPTTDFPECPVNYCLPSRGSTGN